MEGYKMIDALRKMYEADIAHAKANVEVYLNNPVAIGEHGNLMEELDKNIGMVTDYQDKLETLRTTFGNTKKELLSE